MKKKKAFKLERLLTTALPLYCVPEYKWYTSDPSILNKMLILDLVTGLHFFFYLRCFEYCKNPMYWSSIENNSTKICICSCTIYHGSLSMSAWTLTENHGGSPHSHRRKMSSDTGIDYTDGGIQITSLT